LSKSIFRLAYENISFRKIIRSICRNQIKSFFRTIVLGRRAASQLGIFFRIMLPPGAPGIDLTANQGFSLVGLTVNRLCYSQENSSPPLIKGTAHG
jgi:hypothetical protein